MGYCPCCVRATHVAIPGSYRFGSYDGLEHTGLRLWAGGGPWAPRGLAAVDYVLWFNERMPLPTGWDWAVKSPEFQAPGPLFRGAFGGAPLSIPTVAQAHPITSAK